LFCQVLFNFHLISISSFSSTGAVLYSTRLELDVTDTSQRELPMNIPSKDGADVSSRMKSIKDVPGGQTRLTFLAVIGMFLC
jgi:hypothetical protein